MCTHTQSHLYVYTPHTCECICVFLLNCVYAKLIIFIFCSFSIAHPSATQKFAALLLSASFDQFAFLITRVIQINFFCYSCCYGLVCTFDSIRAKKKKKKKWWKPHRVKCDYFVQRFETLILNADIFLPIFAVTRIIRNMLQFVVCIIQ